MRFTTDYKLEDYILNTSWEQLPDEVRTRIRGCLIDLTGALIAGSRSRQFEVGLELASKIYGRGEIAVIGSNKRFGFMGASAAMGHSSNAYDIDDGHNITRAHPGTSFIGGLLAAAYERDITLEQLFVAMLVSYETTVRIGAAMMDYYNYAHSSGTFGAVGVVAGVGRIYGFDRKMLNGALSIADFNAPLVPGIRSVEYPSMNKDGVPFGVMIGALAVVEAMCGFEGNKNLLEADEYKHYLDDLGEKYQVLDLYFKPYPCCRWAHPAIDACTSLMRENQIKPENITRVAVKTFKRATMLSKSEPKTADEAQYNIAYPVAAAVVRGDFGIREVMDESLSDPRTLEMMKKLCFEVDENYDKAFPAKRICRVEIETVDGKKFTSGECEPRGEAHENISISWLSDKFVRIAGPFLKEKGAERILSIITGDISLPVRNFVDAVNEMLN